MCIPPKRLSRLSQGHLPRRIRSIAAGIVLLALPAAAQADRFHMSGGNVIDGQVLEDLGDRFVVRVAIGTIEIEKKEINERIIAPTPWERYEAQKKKHADTADGHWRLADWCRRNGLRDQERDHLRRTLDHDPDHADARLRLGYRKSDGRWIDPAVPGRSGERHAAPPQGSDPPPAPGGADVMAPVDPPPMLDDARRKEQERLVQQILAKWNVRVKAIFRGGLAGDDPDVQTRRFREARDRILAIRDPLAIHAIAGVLSTGSVASRQVLIEALSKFPQDEATMNLVVVAVLDPSADIRRRAAVELIPRRDERISRMLREALKHEDEHVLRRAAAALGVLRDRAAIADLIDALSYRVRMNVTVARPVFLKDVTGAFARPTVIDTPHGPVVHQPRQIGVLADPYSVVGTVTVKEMQVTEIPRTEVQEALIAICGRNFGFDVVEWKRWLAEQNAAPPVADPSPESIPPRP